MADIITDGWLELDDGSDYLKVMFDECKYDWVHNPTVKHYSGGVNSGYTLGKKWLEFKVRNIWFTNHTTWSNFSKYLDDFQDGGRFTLKIRRDVAGNYIAINEDTSWDVMVKKNGCKDMQKIGFEDEQIYQIGFMIFEEAG